MKSQSVIIQINAAKQYFPVVLFIYYAVQVILTFESADEILRCEQYFPAVQFIILYKVVLSFVSLDEIPKCYHSIESY